MDERFTKLVATKLMYYVFSMSFLARQNFGNLCENLKKNISGANLLRA